ncbi:unnamed protein product [Dicrocoelium dendriticum]|nr:unnamed protein product [Dicrocoelium dendriticum]CAH8668431.1 unnamed protein product [Dicrocoelium dendriticum]
MPDNNRSTIRVGSRCSQLALVQTNIAIGLLNLKHPSLRFEVSRISTVGDKILDVALSKIGDKNLFTKELDNALLNKQVDFVVHSLKDVPTIMPDGLVLGCVFDRTSPEDVVLMSPANRGRKLCDLPSGSVIGTSSVRRVATLTRLYPHLNFVSVRGNLNTRLRKLDESNTTAGGPKYDAVILARAGIDRLGWSDRIDQVLTDGFYAVGQGALACQCRRDDPFILTLLADLHSETAALSSIAERSLMRHLDGGCSTPIGVSTKLFPNTGGHPMYLHLRASVLSLDGGQCVEGDLLTDLSFHIAKHVKRVHSPDLDGVSDGCEYGKLPRDTELPKVYADESDESEGSSNISVPETVHSPTSPSGRLDSASTEEELRLAKNPSSTFMGVHVNPMCDVARLRMARAQRLGHALAERLLSSGAAEILEQLRASSAALEPKPNTTAR